MEIRPAVPQIVHHANILIDRTASFRRAHPAQWKDGVPGMELEVDTGNEFDPDSNFLFWKPDTPVMCGIGMMCFAEFGKFREAGLAIPLSLALVLLATLTFSPALLRLAGRWAFWPRHTAPAASASERGFIGGGLRGPGSAWASCCCAGPGRCGWPR